MFTRKFFSENYIPENVFFRNFLTTFSARVVARQGYLQIFGGPWGRQGVLRGKIFTRKIFSKNCISEKYFSGIFLKLFPLVLWPDRGIQGYLGAPGGRQGVLRGKFLREKFSPKIIYPKSIFQEFLGKLFPLVLWPDRGIQGSLGALGGRQGVLREKFYAKNFLKKLHIRKVFFGIFGKLFPSRVVARQGYLGIFGGPWGTLGGTEGKKFYAKNFLQKLYIRKVFFGIFGETCFRSCCGPIGVFRDLWGMLGDSLGVLRGKNFTRKIFSKNYISEKYFSGIFRKLFPLVLWPDRGIQGSLGALGDARGY